MSAVLCTGVFKQIYYAFTVFVDFSSKDSVKSVAKSVAKSAWPNLVYIISGSLEINGK